MLLLKLKGQKKSDEMTLAKRHIVFLEFVVP